MDLIFFLAILAIFVCLFCVTTQATLYPGNTFNIDLLKKLIDKAYWYNHLFIFLSIIYYLDQFFIIRKAYLRRDENTRRNER
jgi:hypothetical protein